MPPRGRKRKAHEAPAAATPATPEAGPESGSRRRSARVSSSGKKSLYFEDDDNDSDLDDEGVVPKKAKTAIGSAGRPRGRPPKKQSVRDEDEDDGDAYQEDSEEENGDDDDQEDNVDEEFDDDSEEEVKPKSKSKPQANGKAKSRGRPKKKQPDQDEDDEEFDENAPAKVTVIPLAKMRDVGDVEYADDRVHPNTLLFLKDLKAHNQRSWLKHNDAEYRRSLKDWETFVAALQEKIIEVDETIPELPFKDVNFRIYRDIRFSKNPLPYKTHYGAAFSRTGRKGPYACYYIHCEPGSSFIGGGLWQPDADAIAKLRASIDERPERWRRMLLEPTFRRVFLSSSSPGSAAAATKKAAKPKGKGRSKEDEELDELEAVKKAFAAHNQENALKTKPKGFLADHRDIELLKLRNFTVGKKIPAELFTRDGGLEEIAGYFGAMVGFVTHLNRVVMPDPGDDDDSDEDEGDEE